MIKNIYFTKKEIAFIEQLIKNHIELYECDAEGDDDIKADLIDAESIHYKILKHKADIDKSDNNKKWFSNGKLHREDGPAVEYSDGEKKWFLNDKLHREDGPAVEYSDGYKVWYLNGISITEDEFNDMITDKI